MIRIKSFESYENNHVLMEYFQNIVDNGYRISIGENWMGSHSETAVRIYGIPFLSIMTLDEDPKVRFRELLSMMKLWISTRNDPNWSQFYHLDSPTSKSIVNELKDLNFIKQIESTSNFEFYGFQFFNVKNFRDNCDLALTFKG